MVADLYIPAFGTTPNTKFVNKSFLIEDGRFDTNALTLRVDKAGPCIYANGDVASYTRSAIRLVLESIPVLCANIERDLLRATRKGKSSVHTERMYEEDIGDTQIVPVCKSKSVSAAMDYRLPNVMVWLIKG